MTRERNPPPAINESAHKNGPQDVEKKTELPKGCLPICFGGEAMILHWQGALYWPSRHCLLVSDVHLGKEFVFQRASLGVPAGSSTNDIQRLTSVVEEFDAQHIIVLGDIVHALPHSAEPWLGQLEQWLNEWRQKSHRTFTVITGNHDKPGVQQILPDCIQWHDFQQLGPFALSHEPRNLEKLGDKSGVSGANVSEDGGSEDGSGDNSGSRQESHFQLCGHLHPGVVLGAARDRLRIPVFWVTDRQLVLPAFGSFTGLQIIEAGQYDRIYGIGPETVMPLPV